MIEEIKRKLREIDENVQYGICRRKSTWDCLLVKKVRNAKSGSSNLDDSRYVTVSVIREDEIPDDLPKRVETAMREIGFRRTSKDADFEYTMDANEIVIEICTIEFVKAKKCGGF